MLAEFRPDTRQEDRQQPPEELIEEDRQVIPEARPDYQAVRDRILKSLTTGRGRIAPSAPQYKSAVKVLDRFISEIERVAPVLEQKENIEQVVSADDS